MKEEMESLEITAVIRELQQLIGGYLQKIYEPRKRELLFRIHVPGEGSKMLLFKLGKAIYLTERDIENPKHPNDYIMLMRKHLSNAKISEINQHDFDRVVEMKLQKRDKFRLIFEVFGKGNLVLAGDERILLPYKSESWSHRELKEGEVYKFPPSRINPFDLENEKIRDILLNSEKDLVRSLAVDLNLGGKYAEEICKRLDIDKNVKDFKNDIDNIINEIKKLKISTQNEELDPYVVKSDKDIIDAVPFKLEKYKELENTKVKNYNKALDLAFFEGEKEDEEKKAASSKLERKLEQQQRAVENLRENVEVDKNIAELIYQNYKQCEEILEAIHRARDEGRREEIYEKMRELDYVVQLNDSDEYIVVELEGEVEEEKIKENVKLDFRKDVNENAQKYYKKSKKNKRKIEGAKRAIEETKKEIEEGKQVEKKEKKKKPTTKYWFDRYKWFISSDGNLVVAGKDTKTNEEVVKKYMEKGCRYAHADAGGAPSVVVLDDKGDVSKDALKEACQYAVIHSKEWKRGIAAGRGYWVKPYQVSKTAESGESLPTGAFVIRGKRNYIDNLSLEVVLAEIEYKGNKKVMCAPSYALEDRDKDEIKRYVKFIPGTENLNDFAKDMSNFFNVPIKEIQKILPPGDVKIIKKVEKEKK